MPTNLVSPKLPFAVTAPSLGLGRAGTDSTFPGMNSRVTCSIDTARYGAVEAPGNKEKKRKENLMLLNATTGTENTVLFYTF